MHLVGKEPFPTIYVDSKTDGEVSVFHFIVLTMGQSHGDGHYGHWRVMLAPSYVKDHLVHDGGALSGIFCLVENL